MKKVLFFAAVTLAAASCLKDEAVVVETSQELNFKAMANVSTKADAQLTGTVLTGDYRIYASATQRNADGTIENPTYFTDMPFDTEDAVPTAASTYHAWDADADAMEPIYWPIGGCQLDYVAYAMPVDVHDATPALTDGPVASYDNETTDVSSLLAFDNWDTYKNQVDVLYAVKNGATTTDNAGSNTVGLTFNHAQALLVFEAKVNIADVLQIDEVKIDGLLVKGDFIVDNTKNNLNASWQNLATVSGEDVVAEGADPAADNIGEALANTTGFEQVGSTLLVPQQPALNFVVTYTVSGKTMQYTYNHARTSWEKGKKYIYRLDFTLNEVVVTETVVDYVDVEYPTPLS